MANDLRIPPAVWKVLLGAVVTAGLGGGGGWVLKATTEAVAVAAVERSIDGKLAPVVKKVEKVGRSLEAKKQEAIAEHRRELEAHEKREKEQRAEDVERNRKQMEIIDQKLDRLLRRTR